MRLKRISLLAMLLVTVVSGCSASRRSLNPLRRDNNSEAILPPVEHEYHPRIEDRDQPLQSVPVPHETSPAGEPVPAPPAIGVSRVKSVSWLKSIGSKLHGRPAPPPEDCVNEPHFEIGACSPVDSCTQEPNCRSAKLVQRYREQNGTPPVRGELRSAGTMKQALAKLFHCHQAMPNEDCAKQSSSGEECQSGGDHGCSKSQTHRSRSTPHQTESAAAVNACREDIDCGTEAIDPPQRSSATNLKRRRECLAEPLQEPFQQDAIQAPEVQGHRVPESAVPPIPAAPIPENGAPGAVRGVPGIPGVPAGTGTSLNIVEPPVWPRNQGRRGTPVPIRQSQNYMRIPTVSATQGSLPQVVPGSRR